MIKVVKKFCENRNIMNNLLEKNLDRNEFIKIIKIKEDENNRLKYRIKILISTIDNLEKKKI